ncbi:MAG: hypothetical protein JXA18_14205 [Chitinispirillaceae bacterium]|nr:hypothetical protein [Chitinispirillaceae bacterium]
MRSFKSAITRRVNKLLGTPGAHVFQPRFHDHIIRNEKELFLVRHYIRNNPANWEIDDELNDAIKHHDRRRSPWYVRMP